MVLQHGTSVPERRTESIMPYLLPVLSIMATGMSTCSMSGFGIDAIYGLCLVVGALGSVPLPFHLPPSRLALRRGCSSAGSSGIGALARIGAGRSQAGLSRFAGTRDLAGTGIGWMALRVMASSITVPDRRRTRLPGFLRARQLIICKG